MYQYVALLVAAALLFHFTSKEETILLAIAAVAIVYMLKK